ncbi:hypothetical protein D3C86_1233640 [compost metagenome]
MLSKQLHRWLEIIRDNNCELCWDGIYSSRYVHLGWLGNNVKISLGLRTKNASSPKQ